MLFRYAQKNPVYMPGFFMGRVQYWDGCWLYAVQFTGRGCELGSKNCTTRKAAIGLS
jgi:hypothetical protein